MPIRVPESQKRHLEALINLSDAEFDAVIQALPTARLSTSSVAMAAAVAPASGLDEQRVQSVLRAAISLYLSQERAPIERHKFVDEVTAQAVELGFVSADDDAKRASVVERILRVLDLDRSIGAVAKAVDLSTENGNPFEYCRILTDVRPVFGRETETEIAAAIILHSLKVTSHGEEGHQVHFFSMTSSDLRELRDVIERAMKKEIALRAALDKASVEIVENNID